MSGGLACVSPAISPAATATGERLVTVLLEWEFQGTLCAGCATAGARVLAPDSGDDGGSGSVSLHSLARLAGPGSEQRAAPGREAALGFVALRGGSSQQVFLDGGPARWAEVSGPPQVKAIQPPTVWAGASALVRVAGRNFQEGASACEVAGRRLPARFISSTLLACEWNQDDAPRAAGGSGPWEVRVTLPFPPGEQSDGPSNATLGGASLSSWGSALDGRGGGSGGGGSGINTGLPRPQLWPTHGPARGGTPVTVRWTGAAGAPPQAGCRFGTVLVGSAREDAGGGLECVAPARASGAADVAVALGPQHSAGCAAQYRYRNSKEGAPRASH